MKFELLRLIGTRPVGIYDGDVVFNASRPIMGTDIKEMTVDRDEDREWPWMGFTTVITPDTYRREDLIDANRRLDARVIEWVTRDAVIAEVKARLLAEYDAELVNGLTDGDLIESWRFNGRTGEVNIITDAYDAYVSACEAENLESHDRHMWEMHGQPTGPLGGAA